MQSTKMPSALRGENPLASHQKVYSSLTEATATAKYGFKRKNLLIQRFLYRFAIKPESSNSLTKRASINSFALTPVAFGLVEAISCKTV